MNGFARLVLSAMILSSSSALAQDTQPGQTNPPAQTDQNVQGKPLDLYSRLRHILERNLAPAVWLACDD